MSEAGSEDGSEEGAGLVRTIGWFWIAIGVLLCIAGASGLLAAVFASGYISPSGFPLARAALYFGGQFVAGAVTLVAAGNLLRHEAWARPVLEIFAWLFGFICAAFVIRIIWSGLAMLLYGMEGGISFLLINLLIVGGFGVRFFVSARRLRCDDVRAVLTG